MEPRNYLVATIYTNPETKKVSTMSEVFHTTIEEALTDYQKRGRQDLVICKVLQVKVVLVDYDAAGQIEQPLA